MVETGQPKRKNFIARQMSFHGNTLGTLSCAFHPTRRAPYEAILDHDNFHHVSPAFYKRFHNHNETEEQYVERLKKELDDKFVALGPETVIGCEHVFCLYHASDFIRGYSCCRNCCRSFDRRRCCSKRLLQRQGGSNF